MTSWYDFGEPPNNNYSKFFSSLKEIDRLEPVVWKTKHFVAYFCKKYFETYGKVFKLSCNTVAPSKCREYHEITRIKYILSSDPLIIKDYFDWAFKTQLVNKKRRITSLRFLTSDRALTEYKNTVLFKIDFGNVQRSSKLPPDIMQVIALFGESITTFGELAFLYHRKDFDSNVKKIFDKISDMGFDVTILSKVV